MNINKIDNLASSLEQATNATVKILKSDQDTVLVPVIGEVPTLNFRVKEEIHNKFGDLNKRLVDAVKTSEAHNKTAETQIADLTTKTDAVATAAKQVQAEIDNGKQLLSDIKSNGEQSVKDIATATSTAKESLTAFGDQLTHDLTELSDHANDAAKSAADSLKNIESVNGQNEKLVANVSALKTAIDEQAEAVKSNTATVSQSLNDIKTIESSVNESKQAVSDLKSEVEQLAEDTNKSSESAGESLEKANVALSNVNSAIVRSKADLANIGDQAIKNIAVQSTTAKTLIDEATTAANKSNDNVTKCQSNLDDITKISEAVNLAEQSVSDNVEIAICGLSTDLLKTHEYIITH